MGEYIRVAEDENNPEDAIELPSDDDGTILLSTIQAQFPGATGLRYRNEETQAWRGVRLADGVLCSPAEGWGSALYIVVSSKTDSSSKRKYEESPTAREPNPKIMKNYSMETDSDDYLGDLIILGLSWKAKNEDIQEYFSRFGELDYYEVKNSPATGQSRGFGFVRFKDNEVAKNVLTRTHTILDRRVDVRMSKGKNEAPRKIFIGRLPNNCTATDIRTYFEKFGALSDVYVPQPYRQFGFVTFASGDVARTVTSRVHVINGARVNVTPAEPKANKFGNNASPSSITPRTMRGYGWNNMGGYGNFGDRSGGGFGPSQMNAMWNVAAMNNMAQGMAQSMGGMGGGMGAGLAAGMAAGMGGGMAAGMGGGMGGGMAAGMAAGMGGGMGAGMNMAALGSAMGGGGAAGMASMASNMSNAMSGNMGGNVSGGGGMSGTVGTSGMESGMNSSVNSGVSNDTSYALWNRDTTRS